MDEGKPSFTLGDHTVEARCGQIDIAPAGTPHKFVNSGTTRARHIDIHTRGRMSTEWLEDQGACGERTDS